MNTTSVKQTLATSLRSAARRCVKAVPLSLIFIGVMASSCRSTKTTSATRAESGREASLSSVETSLRSESTATSAALSLEDVRLELTTADTSALRILLGLPPAATDSSLMSPLSSDTCGTPTPLPPSSRGDSRSPHSGFSLRLTAAKATVGSSGTSVSRQAAATRSDSSSSERATATSSNEEGAEQRSPLPLLCALLVAATLVFLCRRR